MRKPIAFVFVYCIAIGCGGSAGIQSPQSFSLTLSPGPNGTIVASPAGPTYSPGTLVTVTATPAAQWTLQNWTGTDDDKTASLTNHVTMDRDRTVGAQFAQTTCAPDPTTGNRVARMISPVNGATLPAGAVTFTWCNASADYFLAIESVAGAHNIFFAFAGGPGAGVNTLTLGPACATAPPTGCIPPNGETIFVTLYTLKQGNILAPSPFNYSYTAGTQ